MIVTTGNSSSSGSQVTSTSSTTTTTTTTETTTATSKTTTPASSYVVSISPQAYALSSAALLASSASATTSVKSALVTAADTTAPTISSFVPTKGATNVATSSKFTFNFSEKIKLGSGSIAIKDDKGNVVASYDVASSKQLSVSGSTLVLDATNVKLQTSTHYTVAFSAGNIQDLAGNNMAASTAYQFTTVAAPTVSSFTPVNGASNVLTNSKLTLTFNESIKLGSGTISIKDSAGNVVESYNSATSKQLAISGSSLTITPSSSLLKPGTQYSVSLTSDAVEDMAGNSSAATSIYKFTTKALPTITNFNSTTGTTSVATNSKFTFSFSDSVTLGSGKILLEDSNNNIVESYTAATSKQLSLSGKTLTISPTSTLLSPNTQYHFVVEKNAINDISGNSVATNNSYQFTTKALPTVTSFSPVSGATDVAITSKFTFNFSDTIQFGSGSILLEDSNNNVVESYNVASSKQLTLSGKTLTIAPTSTLLSLNTSYHFVLAANTLKDSAGNSLPVNSSYQFTTIADKTPPVLASFSPTSNAKNVALDASLTFNFSKAIKFGTGNINIVDSSGNVVDSYDVTKSNSNVSISSDGKTLTVKPHQSLTSNTTYTVQIAKGALQDVNGNNFAGSSNSFTTVKSGFNINITYSGDATYKKYFDQAKAIWQRVITGVQSNPNGVENLQLSATVTSIDGTGGILGSSSPTMLSNTSAHTPTAGLMKFDSADMANMAKNGTLSGVILHEMAHALGFGTLWSMDGFSSTFGQYTGSNALTVYKQMSGNSSATYVPLETTGGTGTANAHWSESVFKSELMTGYANGSLALSKLTVAAMQDLGYTVNYNAADSYTLGS